MEQKDYRLAAIMYTDIAGFSRMMERDEAGTLELLKYHNDLIAGIVERHHGTVIKTIGDALLIDFKNTVEALQSAMEVQDRLYEHNKENPALPLLVRVGVHLGDIYFFENDALGEGINIAARLQSLARPGCICFSQDVYNQVLNKIEFRAEKLGKVSLKNITKEIHAFEITTPNVEFDPDKDKPRPGYKPGSYLDGQGGEEVGVEVASDSPASARAREASHPAAQPAPVPPRAASSPLAEPAKAPEAARAGSGAASAKADSADRSYSEEGSRQLLTEIRRAILEETKTLGRRMSVGEAREKYGFYGVEAQEVIAAMADQGLIIKRGRGPEGPQGRPEAPVPPGMPPFIAGFGRNARGEFDPSALKSNIEAAVHGIVNEIERSVERNRAGESRGMGYAEKYTRQAERYRYRAERHMAKAGLREGCEDDPDCAEAWRPDSLPSARGFEAYKRGVESQARKTRGGFVGNLTSYLAVNGFLWFLNLANNPGFLWAAIVSAGWGIGVVSTAVASRRARAQLAEIDALPELDNSQLADYKKLARAKDAMAQHAASTIMVPALLALINFLTSPGFLWFLIPTAALLVGYLSHLASYSATKPRLERRLLDSLGIKGGWRNIFKQGRAKRAEVAGLGPYADLYREAETAKDAIAAQLASGQADGVDAELGPSLDQYLGQVKLLAQSANEVDRLVEGIPMADLSKDRAALVSKRDSSTSESLKTEYGRSIEEIDKQEKSYGDLKEQSEVLKLRLGSSVNQLKQMRLDMARLSASPGAEGAAGIEGLKRRTDELAHYLEDLRSGYAESRGDPFAELEEAERKRLAAADAAKGRIEGPKE
jgi:class 3 adenylate cyclase